ncbi:TonB-dependent siderophore receptor [Massilia sp. DWR3-1-1]|uniref:TonB-dependent siderophore receptor n=1 Tax=Massilia sp. DWR3-1-1 TaxID=2804559 RepID=UPI003CEC6388
MSSKHLKYTVVAFAVMQACAAGAQTQPQPSGIAEVIIKGEKANPADRASIGGFGEASVLQTPVSITVVDQQKLQDFSIRNATEAMIFDASVSDAYNAIGYAENFSIRGFNLDNTSSYRKDGLAIPGDTQIPLENKERIEVLKGLAGLQAGVAAPGGIINFVTKRPTNTDLRTATVEVRERGTVYGAVDVGGRFEDRRFGYRINAAAEKLRSYVKGADGERQFVAAAFDWQISPDALLQVDADYQHKSQLTAPGYQLIAGVALPSNISQTLLLNDQPWARPVDTRSTNVGARFSYRFNETLDAEVAINKHWFKRDDYTAFPYGCSNEGAGFYPGFCSNGDYDVYDYQSAGETKTPLGAEAQLHAKFATGAVSHQLTAGMSIFTRQDKAGDYVYDYAGYSNIYHPLVTAPAPGKPVTGAAYLRRRENERAVYVQDIAALTGQLKLYTGLRYVELKRDEFVAKRLPYAHSEDHYVLPTVALQYSLTPDWNVYVSATHGLEHGGVAPLKTAREGTALAPSRSKQFEAGVKGAIGNGTTLAVSAFDIRRSHEFTNADNLYVRAGDERHRGIEANIEGRAGADLRYGASLLALQTRQSGTGVADFDGKRVTDVPDFKSSAWLDYTLPQLPALKLNALWRYSGSKSFDAANTVNVPAYHLFDAGAAWSTRLAGKHTTVRLQVVNLFDKFYWRDVTPALGGYLLTGTPRTLRLSAQVDF